MKICITVGHSILKGGKSTGVSGIVDEYNYNKKLAPMLAEMLISQGNTVDVIICPERHFMSEREEFFYRVPKVNSGKYDLLVELHLNKGDGTKFGTEVLYYGNEGLEYAKRVSNRLGELFENRGAKKRENLYILRNTNPVAIQIESFFCDNVNDCNKANEAGYDYIARLITEGILNKDIDM
ncbi:MULTISPECIES: N-acetylmuramoyl-L-alanine amidase [unclassified Clostridioides]|uniref:N-acetylmuramoyl-L-alanine amidase n=1 Tax=unclassified Clostridioides TaxID=2635829 RepID=UPI001D11F8E8|nr:N-acetylmuramoyl-L-alanine amidase [Clostridioides sp. ES-S-0171-01]MCC0687835.1 N-acetylmuramoyl-L-alanine amidase [Clostridioides sp. ES-S-0056-01]MCC0714682.1 N-acetylmuramoyl-L-alanine amidase [Clostridioides sp. ES-S-0077-01]UDN53324.1 N-acetylmuramoyl-L-alanine amidase [Clostridioides sp. ES-S-0054-01]